MDLTIRRFVATLLLALAFNPAALGQTVDSEVFVVNADMPVVAIGKQSAGRTFLRLPAIEYQFDLAANCPVGLTAETISISVADTRKSLATADISGKETTVVKMVVPAAQIGPVAVAGFCVAEDDQETFRIPAVLSLQASLLCANEEVRQMIYASRSLDVTLSCRITEQNPAESIPAPL